MSDQTHPGMGLRISHHPHIYDEEPFKSLKTRGRRNLQLHACRSHRRMISPQILRCIANLTFANLTGANLTSF